ncbi:MAG: GNAT family N-acetyltransferase [Acidobacteriia bacterium]|nr:GNAT family N-acetyltransferase [Terriglobia bacterium]
MNAPTQAVTEMRNPSAPPIQKPALQKFQEKASCRILTGEEYPDWDELVDRSPHGTIFHYSWWLQTSAAEFKILGIRDDRGKLIAGLPIPSQRRLGLKLLHSPLLTPFLGPVFDLSGVDGVCDRLYFMRSHGELLAKNVKSFDSFRYIAGACAPDLQGFLWAGFHVELGYTFRIPSTCSLDQITAGMTRTHLQKLKKALRLNLKVTRDEGLEVLIQLNRKTYERQQLNPAYSPDFLRRLWNAAHSQERAHLYIARTSDDTPSAALLTVHDKRTTYQIVSGVNPELQNVPGAYLVLWHALQEAILAGRDFDFEGSALRGVEPFYRRWGAGAVPTWRINKAGSWRGELFQFALRRRSVADLQQAAASSV